MTAKIVTIKAYSAKDVRRRIKYNYPNYTIMRIKMHIKEYKVSLKKKKK